MGTYSRGGAGKGPSWRIWLFDAGEDGTEEDGTGTGGQRRLGKGAGAVYSAQGLREVGTEGKLEGQARHGKQCG